MKPALVPEFFCYIEAALEHVHVHVNVNVNVHDETIWCVLGRGESRGRGGS